MNSLLNLFALIRKETWIHFIFAVEAILFGFVRTKSQFFKKNFIDLFGVYLFILLWCLCECSQVDVASDSVQTGLAEKMRRWGVVEKPRKLKQTISGSLHNKWDFSCKTSRRVFLSEVRKCWWINQVKCCPENLEVEMDDIIVLWWVSDDSVWQSYSYSDEIWEFLFSACLHSLEHHHCIFHQHF